MLSYNPQDIFFLEENQEKVFIRLSRVTLRQEDGIMDNFHDTGCDADRGCCNDKGCCTDRGCCGDRS